MDKQIKLSTQEKAALRSVRQVLRQQVSQRWTLAALSRYAKINRWKLTYGFKTLYGVTVHRYQTRLRMALAKRLVLRTDLPLKAIAGQCGYSDDKNFIAAFKRHFGCPPSALKKGKGC